MALDEKSSYYDAGGIEVFKIIKAKLTHEQWVGFLLGNCIKYSCRINFKGSPDRDVEKIGVYQRLLEEAITSNIKQSGKEVMKEDHWGFSQTNDKYDPIKR